MSSFILRRRLIILLLFSSSLQVVFSSKEEKEETCLDENENNNDVDEANPAIVWRHRETHHTASNVMISDSDSSSMDSSSLWVYNPHHVAEDDPVNLLLRYKPTSMSKAWKYEFSCSSLPKLALASAGSGGGDATTIWALACPRQDVPRWNGESLTSKAGSVSIFQWNSTRQKARIIHTIYGKNTTDQLGTSIAMSSDGSTIALVANQYAYSAISAKERRRQQQQQNDEEGGDPTCTGSYLDVYHHRNNKGESSLWQPLGSTINSITKVSLSDDGTIMAVVTDKKLIKVYRLIATKNDDDDDDDDHDYDWQEEPFTTSYLRTESVSSMSLSGNGHVLSILQQVKGGIQVVNIYRRFRVGGGNYKWKLDSSILPPPPPPPPPPTDDSDKKNHRSKRSSSSSFGWVASLSANGKRIALSQPSYNGGAGVVRVYDYYDYDDSTTTAGKSNRRNNKPPEWKQVGQSIYGIHPNRRDSLGRHLHLSRDGNHLIIKALSYTAIYDYHGGDHHDVKNNNKKQCKQKTKKSLPRDEL